MLPTVLVASLGNRNLKYREDYVDDYVKKLNLEEFVVHPKPGRSTVNFREFTHWLWQNYATEKPHLKLEIIDKALEHHQEALHHLVLFTTDQTDPRNKHQDTFYEGYLVQQLVEEQYGQQAQLIPYSANPTDEDQLIQVIAPQLQSLIKEQPEARFVYHDAGGTPQMKAVIKELLDYYLPEERFGVSYANQRDELINKKRSFQKKYQSLTLARAFVRQYQYGASLDILHYAEKQNPISDELINYIQLAHHRLNFMGDALPDGHYKSELCRDLIEQRVPQGAIPFEEFGRQSRHEIFEIASICQVYFQQKNYPLFIATFYRLLEEICLLTVEKRYRTDKPWYREAFVKKEKEMVKIAFPNFKKPIYGLPFMMGYVSLESSQRLSKLIGLMIPHISYINEQETGINQLRNYTFLAHGKEYVSEEMIEQECPDFLDRDLPKFFQLLGMPERNIYDQMNDEIIALFNRE